MDTQIVDYEIDLVPRRVLGGEDPGRIRSQVSLGAAVCELLRPDSAGVDGDLARRLADEAEDHAYYRVRLRVSFRRADVPIVRAAVEVRLSQPRSVDVPAPQVWSMHPRWQGTDIASRLNTGVKIDGSVVPDALGAQAEVTREVSYEATTAHIVATGVGEDCAEWSFEPTAGAPILGVHELELVARTSWRLRCTAHVELTATRRGLRGRLIPFRADLPPVLTSFPLVTT